MQQALPFHLLVTVIMALALALAVISTDYKRANYNTERYNDNKAKLEATNAKVKDKFLAFTIKGLKIAAEVSSGKRMTKHEVRKHMEELEVVYLDAIQACLTGARLVIKIKDETPETATGLTKFITFTISNLLEYNNEIKDLLTVMNAKAEAP